MNTCIDIKKRHQDEVNSFEGLFFAFNNQQLKEGLQKVGLNENDTDKIYSLGAGGFIRKDRSASFHAMFERHKNELKKIREKEKTIDVKFCGIDSWNRAVFVSIEKPKRFYGNTCVLFDYDATQETVLEKIDADNLYYFGEAFGCEPMGTLAGNIKIIR